MAIYVMHRALGACLTGIFLPINWGPIKGPIPNAKKVYIFPSFVEKIPSMKGKFPKSDKVVL